MTSNPSPSSNATLLSSTTAEEETEAPRSSFRARQRPKARAKRSTTPPPVTVTLSEVSETLDVAPPLLEPTAPISEFDPESAVETDPHPSFDAKTEDFFLIGDSIAPVVHEELAHEESRLELLDRLDAMLPVEEEAIAKPRPRRNLGTLVAFAVVIATVLSLVAVVRARSHHQDAPAVAAVSPPAPAVVETTAAAPEENAAPQEKAAATDEVDSKTAVEEREEARALLTRRQIPEAIEAARRAVDIDPADATSWLILGAAQMEGNQRLDANESFRSCVKLATIGPVAECQYFSR